MALTGIKTDPLVEDIDVVINKVQALLQQNTVPCKIAIVYPQDSQYEAIAFYFKLKNIPFYCERNINLFTHPFVKKILQLLLYISQEKERPYGSDGFLFEILHFDFYEVPLFEIMNLTLEFNKKRRSTAAITMRSLLREKAAAPAKDLFDTGLDKNLKEVSGTLEKLIAEAGHTGALQMFEQVLKQTPVIKYIEKNEERIFFGKLINALKDLVEKELAKKPGITLNQLMKDIVLVNKASPHLGLILKSGNPGQIQLINPEILKSHSFDHIITIPVKAGIPGQLKQVPEITHMDETAIVSLLNKFVMSISALNNYLKCPISFYYKNIIRTPDSPNEAMNFGSAIHYALENFFKKMSAGQAEILFAGTFQAAAEMVDDFKFFMHQNRLHYNSENFENRILYGEMVLKNYHAQYSQHWNKIVSVERNISGVKVNGVPLKGKLDKLEFNGKEVNIVDYKSGDYEKALTKMKPPDRDNPTGGDYWRQAVFYKILVDNHTEKNWRVASVEFDFIEPDNNKNYRKERIMIGPADIETVKQQFTRAWSNIQARNFYTGCGRPNCHYCNLVKNNNKVTAWHAKEDDN